MKEKQPAFVRERHQVVLLLSSNCIFQNRIKLKQWVFSIVEEFSTSYTFVEFCLFCLTHFLKTACNCFQKLETIARKALIFLHWTKFQGSGPWEQHIVLSVRQQLSLNALFCPSEPKLKSLKVSLSEQKWRKDRIRLIRMKTFLNFPPSTNQKTQFPQCVL